MLRKPVRRDTKADGVSRDHPIQILGMRLHIIPENDLDHAGALGMSRKDKRPPIIIIFKILV